MQAYLAAKSGAEYTAPYINRIDNMGFNGIQVTKEIQDIFENHGFRTSMLAASFKNSQQVLELCRYGIGAVLFYSSTLRECFIPPENVLIFLRRTSHKATSSSSSFVFLNGQAVLPVYQ